MDKNNRQKLFSIINEKLYEYNNKIQEESRKTIIHKISLDEENLEYSAKGSVPGNLLNQFSMDEHDGKFRVATTNEYYSHNTGNVRYNACGYNFENNTRYLVHTFGEKGQRTLETGLCSGNKNLGFSSIPLLIDESVVRDYPESVVWYQFILYLVIVGIIIGVVVVWSKRK